MASPEACDLSRKKPIHILVANCTRMDSGFILATLRGDNRFKVIEEVASPEHFGQALLESEPGVVIVAGGANEGARLGFAMLRYELARFPRIRAVMFLDQPTRQLVVEAFRAGAHGVICRNDDPEALCKCVSAVHAGQIWANSEQLGYVLEAFSRRWWLPHTIQDSEDRALLSKRELEVVRCVSEGMTNRNIASRLKLSEHTVKNYMFRIFEKLGVSNRAELILYAINHSCRPEECPVSGPVDPAECERCTVAFRIEAPLR